MASYKCSSVCKKVNKIEIYMTVGHMSVETSCLLDCLSFHFPQNFSFSQRVLTELQKEYQMILQQATSSDWSATRFWMITSEKLQYNLCVVRFNM